MTIRVLFVGFDPATMALGDAPAGTAANIQAGIERSLTQLTELGHEVTWCPLNEGDDEAEALLRTRLQDRSPDCVVIGAGLRLIPKHTVLFEALVNAVVELAPQARLAFNASPADAAEAVQRWFPQ